MTEYSDADIPRSVNDPDPVLDFIKVIDDLRERLGEVERGASLRNASITGGSGIRLYDDNGDLRLWLRPGPTGGVIEAFNETGDVVVRMGRMANTGPSNFGIEVLTSGGWVQLGSQSVTWSNIAGKPATYPVDPHTHWGTDITTPVGEANGSSYAFNNNVGGTTFYALWVGNDGGYTFGRNTSSRKYKKNIRPYQFNQPTGVLALEPVIFDRLPTRQKERPKVGIGPENEVEVPGAIDEVGLIAEETVKHVPEIVTYYDGKIDGIRYDLIGLALLPVVKEQAAQIKELQTQVALLAEESRKRNTP